MPSDHQQTYDKLCETAREVQLLETIEAILDWDERTQMPEAGGAYRAEQVSYLAGLAHRKRTDPQVGEYLAELADSPLAADPHSDTGANIRLLKRDYDKRSRLPQDLVEALARAAAVGQQTWVEARKENNFQEFQPQLEKILTLKRQEAAAVGYDTTPYDPLLDDYEQGESTANVTQVLEGLRDALVPLVQGIADSGRVAPVEILQREFAIDAQGEFGRYVTEAIGFDFGAGRLDVTVHPFCTGLGPGDVRLTTRYDSHNFSDAFFSTLHEAGHGIYDQGLPREHYGLPIGQDVSMGIHESQSRMWENQVGLSRPFWDHFYPQAQSRFSALADVPLDDFYWAANDVRPSLIRVDADEVTYNLHILIRFELEKALIEDRLPVAELPAAWNEKYKQYLGIDVPTDTEGVLQDVHWSAALFGYFPTYSLGNLYAAQFFAHAEQDLGDLDEQFRRGEFQPLREWLREHIHRHGRRYSPAELVERVTGKPLSHEALMTHLTGKFGELYGL